MTAPAKGKSTGIASALGGLQHARIGPQPVPAEAPDTRAAASPHTRIPGAAKRNNPDYEQLKAYVTTGTKQRAMRKAQDEGYEDFSALVQKLLDAYLRT